MYAFLSELLSDKQGDVTFSCFGLWHLCYLIFAAMVMVIIVLWLKKKDKTMKQKITSWFIYSAFALYVADFFLMPFAYGEIDIEKLPFHICTAMCVMNFWSCHHSGLGKYKQQFAVLGFLSNLVYMIYPAGLMWYQVHPLSYRVVQTLLFHGLMTGYGLLMLIFGDLQLNWKLRYKDLAVIVGMTLWAVLGNVLYTGEAWGRTNNFNWFFVTQDPFYMVPETMAPYIMPFLNVGLFFIVELLIYGVCYWRTKREIQRCNQENVS